MEQDSALRAHLVKLLSGGQAYQPLSTLLKDLSAETAGKTVQDLPYTIWQLVDHMRYTLEDILEFINNPNYQEPNWPDDYWPKEKAPGNQAALDKSINAISKGKQEMIKLVQDTSNDLYKPFPHGDGQTLLREALLVAEHNAYHVGEVIVLRRLLGDWE
ncbi:DinB family protein [Pontibacter cellulosilyticus]|uniref:DinB family protein n=1 Tax=Pontibacter cellulosilyticus TaxID=1720253 RepID=A0A923N7J1_9BACT|nr:DinB family protein [Pontibacter cellulosilyticus]MBC5991925.1 DinB family protein [Pontibacter cellulosilyticus]